MGMPYLKSLRYSAVIVAALVLTACGGGGGASVTNITQSDASAGITIAKSSEAILREEVIGATQFVETLALFTGLSTASTGNTYSVPILFTTTICPTSGSVSTSYKKVTQKTGLTVGDSYKLEFSNCVSNGYKMTGTVVLTALTTTSVDVSNASGSIALPMSVNYQALSSELLPVVINSQFTNTKETYTGTLSFNTLNYMFPTSSVGIATSSSFTYSFEDIIDPTVLTINYGALTANATVSSTTGAVTGTFTSNVSVSATGSVSGSASMTLAAATTSPNTTLEATQATYTMTNYLGGKVVGALPPGSAFITITVDNGNNGSIDNTYTGLFADF